MAGIRYFHTDCTPQSSMSMLFENAVCLTWAIFLIAIVALVILRYFFSIRVRKRSGGWHDIRDYKGAVTIGIAGITFVLALAGHLYEGARTSGGTAGPAVVDVETASEKAASAGSREESVSEWLVNAFYESAQIFLLNDSTRENDLSLYLARMGAVAVTLLVASEALHLLFADSVRKLWLSRTNGHVIVCGLGRVGGALVEDLLGGCDAALDGVAAPQAGRSVVIVEIDPQNHQLQSARDAGANVIIGDATDQNTLSLANVAKSEAIFFLTGSDESNLEGAIEAAESLERKPESLAQFAHGAEPASPESNGASASIEEEKPSDVGTQAAIPSIYVHMRRLELGSLLKNHERIIPFNLNRRIALDVVTRLLLNDRPTSEGEVAHYVIVGFSDIGQEVVRLLAELAHFENLKRSRMTVVYAPGEAPAVEIFCSRHPRLFPNFDGEELHDPWAPNSDRDDWSYGISLSNPTVPDVPTEFDIGIGFVVNGCFHEDAAAPASEGFIRGVTRLAGQPNVKPFVLLCGDAEEQNYTLGRELRDELDQRCRGGEEAFLSGLGSTPIYAFVPKKPMLTKLSAQEEVDLTLFGACHEVCTFAELSSDIVNALADTMARAYDSKKGKAPKLYSERSTWEQYSNLSAAAHAQVKLARLGYTIAPFHDPRPAVLPTEVADKAEAVIAQMEHHRWCSERLLNGWEFGARNTPSKKRIQLVPWSNLPEDEANKDLHQLQAILDFFKPDMGCESTSNRPFKLVNRK